MSCKLKVNLYIIVTAILLGILPLSTMAQIDEDKLGAWYMYFWSTGIKNSSFGFQGDIQYRNWNAIGDLEQLLLRGGLTYTPKGTDLKFTLGYGHITSGEYGDSDNTSAESRIYQEALLPQKLGSRIFITHRFRYEQRWVENQDFRTRWRYFININAPLNQPDLKKGAVYLSFYNELFVNAQKDIGNGRSVEYFDRNRLYFALGYSISDNLRTQIGFMEQTTDNISKGQLQVGLHHWF